MTSPIERMARALADSPLRQLMQTIAEVAEKEWNEDSYMADMRTLARAALLAIRDPSEGMVEAVWHPKCYGDDRQLAAREIWQTMIDKAAEEKP